MQIIIVAGGGGTRLWPLSTDTLPKQYVPIVGKKSSLEKVYEYVSQVFSKDQIWVNTNVKHAELLAKTLPTLSKDRMLLEPEKRDTFPALAAQAAKVSHFTSDKEPIIYVTSDEFFESEQSASKFMEALKKIGQTLEQDIYDIVTLGIKVTSPNINYGYIEVQPTDNDRRYQDVVPVVRFTEKPELEKAQEFMTSGNYLWHKFNCSFNFAKMKQMLAEIDPKSLEILLEIEKTGVIDPQKYRELPKISIDYQIMERTKNIGVIGLDVDDWIDVGNWEIAKKYLDSVDQNEMQVQMKGDNNSAKLHNPNRKVAFVGVSNIMLVESPEGILVLEPSMAAEVKKVAEYFEGK